MALVKWVGKCWSFIQITSFLNCQLSSLRTTLKGAWQGTTRLTGIIALQLYCLHPRPRHFHDALTRKQPYVQVKTQPPYQASDEEKVPPDSRCCNSWTNQAQVYLDPTARAEFSPQNATWQFAHDKRARQYQQEPPLDTPKSLRPKAALRRSLSGSALTNLEVALREMVIPLLQYGMYVVLSSIAAG